MRIGARLRSISPLASRRSIATLRPLPLLPRRSAPPCFLALRPTWVRSIFLLRRLTCRGHWGRDRFRLFRRRQTQAHRQIIPIRGRPLRQRRVRLRFWFPTRWRRRLGRCCRSFFPLLGFGRNLGPQIPGQIVPTRFRFLIFHDLLRMIVEPSRGPSPLALPISENNPSIRLPRYYE